MPACHRGAHEASNYQNPFPPTHPAVLSTSRVSPKNLLKSHYLRCLDKEQAVSVSAHRWKPYLTVPLAMLLIAQEQWLDQLCTHPLCPPDWATRDDIHNQGMLYVSRAIHGIYS